MERADGDGFSRISAVVITCDKSPTILRAVLKSVSWADELIVVDKGREPAKLSTFAGFIGLHELDRIHVVPWTPTVEETRAFAVSKASNEWIVLLDDDEILSSDCENLFRDVAKNNSVDVVNVPIKQYILGRHDSRAYYWPEYRPCLFRRGSIEFTDTVHAGSKIIGEIGHLTLDHPVYITHLSHPDVATWLEKTNRYTSRPDRSGVSDGSRIVTVAHKALNRWLPSAFAVQRNDYLEAVGLLRAIYDMVDALKRWEASQPDGHAEFERIALEVLGR